MPEAVRPDMDGSIILSNHGSAREHLKKNPSTPRKNYGALAEGVVPATLVVTMKSVNDKGSVTGIHIHAALWNSFDGLSQCLSAMLREKGNTRG